MTVSGPILAASAATAVCGAMVVKMLVRPAPSLRRRVDPYLTPSLPVESDRATDGGKVYGPILKDLADKVGRFLDSFGSEYGLDQIRQAGWYRDLREEDRVPALRLRELGTVCLTTVVSIVAGRLVGVSLVAQMALVALGFLVGAGRVRGRLKRAIEERRHVMRIEIYTINQLLAMRVRVGGGVMNAISATVDRGTGEVVSEFEDALRLHRAGWSGGDALRRIAELTPEPFCSRTYRLLASAEEQGGDLSEALLFLSEDVREARREAVKRAATRRRAAMLVPTIAILAPVLILFVAAPLPYLITSWQ